MRLQFNIGQALMKNEESSKLKKIHGGIRGAVRGVSDVGVREKKIIWL